jgi:hypothetical protein
MIVGTHGLIASQITQFVGLLDLYPSAAAAYSLRLLRSAYTGSAIRVRRAVGSPSETDIGFVNNELDVATLESFCSGTNGFVTTWYDQSGNGRNATQTTATNQPQIVSAGSVTIDPFTNKVAIYNPNQSYLLQASMSLTQPTTYFVVINATTTLATMSMVSWNASSTNFFNINSNNTIDFTAGTVLSTVDTIIDNETFLAYALVNSTNSEVSINNNLARTGNMGSNIPDGTLQMFSRNFINQIDGYLSELIIYNSNESSNRTGISTNINDFYSIY